MRLSSPHYSMNRNRIVEGSRRDPSLAKLEAALHALRLVAGNDPDHLFCSMHAATSTLSQADKETVMARENFESDQAFELGKRLSIRIKDVAKNKGFDTRKALARYACESLVRALLENGRSKFMLKGGLLYAIDERATDDLDIVFKEKRSAVVVLGDVQKAARALEAEGLSVRIKKVVRPHTAKRRATKCRLKSGSVTRAWILISTLALAGP
jgi:hypothetical protein